MTKVYVCITGDLFHYGHIEFLKKAREFGDQLVVGVCSDSDVQSYKRRPIMTLEERILVIESCKHVDQVVKNAPAITSNLFIQKHQIDIVVATKSYSPEVLNHYFNDPINLNILKLVDYTDGISTSQIIKRCYERYVELHGDLGELVTKT